MLTRNEILAIRALKNRSERTRTGQFIVEGVKGILELAKSDMEVKQIYVVTSMLEHIPTSLSWMVIPISPKEMERISSLKTPPGILGIATIPDQAIPQILDRLQGKEMPFALVAAGIADPGNLGTLIRLADWFGLAGVICTEGTTDPWSAKCVQASMGSVFRVPLGLWKTESFESFAPFRRYALDTGGMNYTAVDWEPGLIIVGSESHGIPSSWSTDETVRVGIPRQGKAESLNAAIAGSIVTAEVARCWALKA